jgi:hypothetical protein
VFFGQLQLMWLPGKPRKVPRSPGRQGKLLHQPKLTLVEDGVMNGNSYRLVFKDPRFYILSILVAVLLALFMAPQTFAARPCKDGQKNPPSYCVPDGTQLTPGSDTVVKLHGEFSESHIRGCKPEANLLTNRGNYKCESSSTVAISYRELGDAVSSRKNLSWMCDALNIGIQKYFSIESYIYGWTDTCDDGSCSVEVRLVSKDPLIQNITFGKSDQLEITLFGIAEPQSANPFDEDLELIIHSIETDFKKTGTTRTAVLCHHDVDTALGDVTLISNPAPGN